jgi:hypothetical protein
MRGTTDQSWIVGSTLNCRFRGSDSGERVMQIMIFVRKSINLIRLRLNLLRTVLRWCQVCQSAKNLCKIWNTVVLCHNGCKVSFQQEGFKKMSAKKREPCKRSSTLYAIETSSSVNGGPHGEVCCLVEIVVKETQSSRTLAWHLLCINPLHLAVPSD